MDHSEIERTADSLTAVSEELDAVDNELEVSKQGRSYLRGAEDALREASQEQQTG